NHETALAQAAGAADVQACEERANAAAQEADRLRCALNAARAARETAEREEATARTPLEEAEREVQRVSAGVAALTQMLRPAQDLWPPLIDAVKVQPGYEAAFAAALGDEINAPL